MQSEASKGWETAGFSSRHLNEAHSVRASFLVCREASVESTNGRFCINTNFLILPFTMVSVMPAFVQAAPKSSAPIMTSGTVQAMVFFAMHCEAAHQEISLERKQSAT
jgi:hypothetical protein